MSLADFQILANIPVVLISRPSASLILKVSNVFVHVSQVSYSSKDGFLEFYEVLAIVVFSMGSVVGVLGLIIVLSRYPQTPFIWTIVLIVSLYRIQFKPLNLSNLFSCSGISSNV